MGIQWFRNRLNKDRDHLAVVALGKDGHAGAAPGTAAKANQHYFRLWLKSMVLSSRTKWFRDFAPMVHSVVKLQYGNRASVEIPHAAGRFSLKDVKAGNLDRVVSRDHALTSLLPFRGGTVELTAGLFSVLQHDSMDAFLKTLGSFSALLSQPAISAALTVAAPLANGVQNLLGASDNLLCVGLDQTFTGTDAGQPLADQYFAVFRADDQVDVNRLQQVDGVLKQRNQNGDWEELTGVDYMLFRVEVTETRDDFDGFPSIDEPYKRMRTHLVQGKIDDADKERRKTFTAVIESDDITDFDRRRILELVNKEYEFYRGMGGSLSGFESDDFAKPADTLSFEFNAPGPPDAGAETTREARPPAAAKSAPPKPVDGLAGLLARGPSLAEARNQIDLDKPLDSYFNI